MGNRERRQAIQEHLAGQHEKAATVLDHNEGVPSGYVRAPFMDGMLPLICEGLRRLRVVAGISACGSG